MRFESTLLRAFAPVLALGLSVVVGCGDDPASNNPDPNNPGNTNTGVSWTAPKQGSTYDSNVQMQDEDRQASLVSFPQSDTLKRTDLGFAGKTGVHAFVSAGDTTYIKYESNGDFSIWVETNEDWFRGMSSQWVTIPVSSKSTKTDTLANVRNYYPDGSSIDVPMKLTGSFGAVSDGETTIGGKKVATKSVRWTITRTEGSMLYRIYADWTVAPSIGYITKLDFLSEGWAGFGIDIPGGGYVMTLASYSLK